MSQPESETANYRMVFDEGPATLQLPDVLNQESYKELEYWIKGILARFRRNAERRAELNRERSV